ncbi:MAG: bifunctional pyr operon transcriptional regulator/uracil phosphoribosyltransferase PyrR [Christensenellaceae bacterium]|nr:bifunctional pyr operon transcriptional regulator/uracil phosphoribosyltransferase PyrR [Christensenellaceae bacterium]
MQPKAKVMDDKALDRAVARIAHQIIEKNKGTENLCLVGIQRRGVPLAKKIAGNIELFEGDSVDVGVLDITFYRDDLSLLSEHPVINDTDIGFDVNGKTIVIVDDVLYTGRTARAAIEALMDLGRPERIQLAVLIDRGHRELPIRADYVGKNLPTSKTEAVAVRLPEFDGAQEVLIMDNNEA